MKVGSVMKAVEEPLPSRFEEFDLRFFSSICLADTYNGKGSPADGVAYKAILYGKTVLYEHWKAYHNCSGYHSSTTGEEYHKWFTAACLYLRIQAIARAKYFGEPVPPEYSTQQQETSDHIVSTPELVLLKTHPQYRELEEIFGLTLEPVDEKEFFIRVQVSKAHRRDSAA